MVESTNEELQTSATTVSVPDASSSTPSPLQTDQGKTIIADQVVQKVAGMACREVPGVYAMGSNARRMLNNITDRIPRSQTNVASGVSVEKGEKQAAIDVSIVLEYGYSVVEVAQKIRQNVIQAVEYATALEVVEVNIEVTDVKMPGEDDGRQDPEQPARTSTPLA